MRPFAVAALFAASFFLHGCGSDRSSFPTRTYTLGERIPLGRLTYIVYDTQWLTQFGLGPQARVPDRRFFVIRLSVTNGGSRDVVLAPLTLIDDNGSTHNELSNGEGAPNWVGYLRQAKPAETLQGTVVFDVQPRHYKLKLTDESGERTALVDIPLSFGSETPVPQPGEIQK